MITASIAQLRNIVAYAHSHALPHDSRIDLDLAWGDDPRHWPNDCLVVRPPDEDKALFAVGKDGEILDHH